RTPDLATLARWTADPHPTPATDPKSDFGLLERTANETPASFGQRRRWLVFFLSRASAKQALFDVG
ncbi:MAG: hypothetical protein ABI461_20210, partial [Polyangiaceae bacterium]